MKIAIVDKNPNAKFTQWRAAPDPKKFFYRDNSIIQDIKKYDPDIVFINKGHAFVNLLKAIKNYKSAYFYGDWYQPVAQYVKLYAAACDIAIFTNKDPVIRYELKPKKIHFVDQGVDIEIFKPVKTEKIYDIVFPGNFFGSQFCGSDLRINLVRNLINHGYNIQVVGDGWPEDIGALPKQGANELNITLNQAKISVGISHFIDVPYYTSNRLYQCMATGTPHITWYSPGISDLFRYGYLDVKSFDQLYGYIDEFLADENKCQIAGSIQHKEIIKRHTIFNTWEKIEKILWKSK